MKVTDCLLCNLALQRTRIVSGEGVREHIMIVGEAPGYQEDKRGSPFVGPSGLHLNVYCYLFGLSRESNLYVTNVVKCRPRNNDTPTITDCVTCSNAWLAKELELVKPKLLILLGNVALRTITNNFDMQISKVHGIWFGKNHNIIAMYHPSYAMRNCNKVVDGRNVNSDVFDDFVKVINKYQIYNPNHKINF